MEKIGNTKFYTFEEVLDEQLGQIGTPQRDEHEAEVAEAIHVYNIGKAIKKAREQKKLTQEELGEMIGVRKGQISKIESGRNITVSTIMRVFKAMGINAKLDMGSLGSVPLW